MLSKPTSKLHYSSSKITAELIEQTDWKNTELGPMESWPIGLTQAVRMMMVNPLPICIAWGKNLVRIYNEPYIPLLRNQHPASYGAPMAASSPAKWDQFEPIFQSVLNGEMFSMKDLKVDLVKNGIWEEAYLDLNLSPIFISEEEIGGVQIMASESTERVRAVQKVTTSENRFKDLIENAPVGIAVFRGSNFIVDVANKAYLPLIGKTAEEFIGKPLFEALPEAKELLPVAQNLVATGQPWVANEYPLSFNENGQIRTRYYTAIWEPVKESDQRNDGFMAVVTEVTQQVEARKKIEASELRLRNLVSQSTVPTAVFFGPKLTLQLVNTAMIELWEIGDKEIVGKPLTEFLPEMADQPFPTLLQEVYESGNTYYATEAPVFLTSRGTVYMDFSYKAMRNENNEIDSILVQAVDVTGVVLSKQKLLLSEANLKNTILKAPVAMCILRGQEYVVEIANEKMYELWGKSAEQLLNQPIFTGLPEAKNQGLEKLLDEVFNTGNTFSAQAVPINLPRNNKIETVYLNFIYEALRESGDKITGIIAVGNDVTEQVLSKQKIEEVVEKVKHSEQEVRSIVESAPFPIGVYVGEKLNILLANKSIMDVWGKGYDVIGKSYIEILPELKGQNIVEQILSVLHTGVPFHAKNQRVDLDVDGQLKPFWFNYSFTPLFDGNRKVYGVMNTAADVTDLNLAKQSVEISEKNFRNVIIHAPVAMCLLKGPAHVVEIANEMMIHLWGKAYEKVMNKPIFEALPDARAQGLEKLLADVYNTGEAFHGTEIPVNLERNGKIDTVYQNFVYDPYRDSEGNVIGVLAISVDVTAQVEARHKIEEKVTERTKELAKANDSLKKSNAELAQFAYIASHDLQEPLRKIKTFAHLLHETSAKDLNEQSLRYLEKISNSTTRMNALIRDVLVYSQVIQDKNLMEKVDLNNVLRNVREDLELLIEQKQADIHISQLPIITAVPLQMTQLFGNLLGNALKFTRPNTKPVIHITSRLAADQEIEQMNLKSSYQYYKIEVRDNGIGFKTENAEQIFNIFQRLHNKTEYEGTGIGLALCKKIALNHQGEITAKESTVEGAVFQVYLPTS